MIIEIVIILICTLFIVLLISFLKMRSIRNKQLKHKSNIEELKSYFSTLSKYNKTKPKYNFPYPVYYINMDKDTDRRRYMESQFQNMNGIFNRVNGIDGKKIRNLHFDTVDGVTFFNWYDDSSQPEIGCALSHFNAIRKAKNDNCEIAVFCEDDISFDTRYLIPSLEEIVKNAPDDWEIIQLFSGVKEYDNRDQKLKESGKEHIYLRREYGKNVFWGCVCYMMNRKGIDRVLNQVLRNEIIYIEPIDDKEVYPPHGWIDFYIYDLGVTYSIYPCLFIPNNTELDSTLHTDHTALHVDNTLKSLRKMMRRI